MRNVIGRAAVAALLCVSGLSCGGDSPGTSLYPVHGKITFKGEPAAGAVITLQPDGPAPQTSQGNAMVPMGTAGEDGSFTLACTGLGDGAPVGKYKAMIFWRPSAKTASPAVKQFLAKKKKGGSYDQNALMPDDPFEGRYSNPSKPLFTAEVKAAGPNELSFDLKD